MSKKRSIQPDLSLKNLNTTDDKEIKVEKALLDLNELKTQYH
jgi:hypothetical protein